MNESRSKSQIRKSKLGKPWRFDNKKTNRENIFLAKSN